MSSLKCLKTEKSSTVKYQAEHERVKKWLNLQSASIMINLDIPWNPAVLEQRIARIHRLGQKNKVSVINMVAAGILDRGEDGRTYLKIPVESSKTVESILGMIGSLVNS